MPQRSLRSRGFFRDPLSGPAGFWATLSHLLLMRAAVFLGVLAVIAGIFGMHVMTGSHASHAAAGQSGGAGHVSPAHASPEHSNTGHSGTAHSSTTHSGGPAHPAADAVVVLSAGAVCAEMCPGAGEPGTSCVPSPGPGALAVVAPPAASVDRAGPGARVTAPTYTYIPSSPTPCELSISRT